jgi:hypothetical protein
MASLYAPVGLDASEPAHHTSDIRESRRRILIGLWVSGGWLVRAEIELGVCLGVFWRSRWSTRPAVKAYKSVWNVKSSTGHCAELRRGAYSAADFGCTVVWYQPVPFNPAKTCDSSVSGWLRASVICSGHTLAAHQDDTDFLIWSYKGATRNCSDAQPSLSRQLTDFLLGS